MILKDDTVLLRDFKREDIAKRIEWETEKTEWQLWDAPWEYEGLTEEQKKEELQNSLGREPTVEEIAVAMQQPPSDKGRRLRLYYITQVAVKPPTFVIFVNDKELMHFSYTRYLENQIRDTFGFLGTPLKFIIRERKENK